jgi:DNA-binding GntR family transcriptional regulator
MARELFVGLYPDYVSFHCKAGCCEAPTPAPVKWQQVRDVMRGKIAAGEWQAGTLLPALPELARQLGAPLRMTQLAAQELAREGLIAVLRGWGTYVAPAPPVHERQYPKIRKREAEACPCGGQCACR